MASSRPQRLDFLWSSLRAARALFLVFLYAVLAPGGYVGLALLCLLWRGDALARARWMQRCSVLGFRFMHAWLRWLRIIHFDWRDVELELPPPPYVLVANHPTQLDPTAVMAALGGGCTIVKSSVFRRRLVRPFLKGGLHIEGPLLDPISVGQVMSAAIDRLRSGLSLFVFPEGTRSPEHGLREFSRIAFEIACRARVPIVSLALRCDPYYLTHETPLLRAPSRMPRLRIYQLALDDPATYGTDSRELKERVEQRYRRWIADEWTMSSTRTMRSPRGT